MKKRIVKGLVMFSIFITLVAMLGSCDNQAAIDRAVAEALREAGVGGVDTENDVEEAINENIIPKENTPPVNETEDNVDSGATNISRGAFDAEAVANGLSVQAFSHRRRNDYKVVLVIENTSDFLIDIRNVNLRAFDSNGNIVAAKSDDVSALPPNTKTVVSFIIDETFSTLDYDFEVRESSWRGVIQNLSFTDNSAQNKEIIAVTNNGDIPAQFVRCHVLFFRGNELVHHDWTFFTDGDSEIKPGRTITEEIRCTVDYDGIMVFFTGRGSRN
jgi:hypothetical protein